MKQTKENTLLLIIKQKFFDEIAAGTKTEEYREIKGTTALKYLEHSKENRDVWLYYDENKIDHDPEEGIVTYNNGVYPYIPIEYKFLHLFVGYRKERDEMIVEVKDITFEPLRDENGKELRFNLIGDEAQWDDNGQDCLWLIVYHLGKIVEIKRAVKK